MTIHHHNHGPETHHQEVAWCFSNLRQRPDSYSRTLYKTDPETLEDAFGHLEEQVLDTFAASALDTSLSLEDLRPLVYVAAHIAFEAYIHGLDRDVAHIEGPRN